ncbi:MAG: nitroreductase, partial [Actinomycetota bacterium]
MPPCTTTDLITMMMSFEEFSTLVAARRTNMFVDHEREVPRELLDQLCTLATWAPNHKKTWPWCFAQVTGVSRAKLGDVAADAMLRFGDSPEKVLKTRTKYLRTPAILVVGSHSGDTSLRSAENRDSTAAGIQNILLGATAAGLASYWSSCPKGANDDITAFCGFDHGTFIASLIYIGWPSHGVEAPVRPPAEIHYFD